MRKTSIFSTASLLVSVFILYDSVEAFLRQPASPATILILLVMAEATASEVLSFSLICIQVKPRALLKKLASKAYIAAPTERISVKFVGKSSFLRRIAEAMSREITRDVLEAGVTKKPIHPR